MAIIYIYSFILGLVLGSFYHVVGVRVPNKQSIVHPPSHCPQCGRRLTYKELIPVLSYLFLKGRCRSCQTRISILYPLFELLTGLLFLYVAIMDGLTMNLLLGWTLVSLLIIITLSDLHYMLIPDKVLIVFFALILGLSIWQPLQPWWQSFVGMAVGFILLFLIAWLSKGGMGGGDIKLFALLGFLMGWQLVLLSFFLATLFGSVVGIVGLMTGYVQREKPFPFGPFIAVGTLIAYFYGNELINWYIQFIIH